MPFEYRSRGLQDNLGSSGLKWSSGMMSSQMVTDDNSCFIDSGVHNLNRPTEYEKAVDRSEYWFNKYLTEKVKRQAFQEKKLLEEGSDKDHQDELAWRASAYNKYRHMKRELGQNQTRANSTQVSRNEPNVSVTNDEIYLNDIVNQDEERDRFCLSSKERTNLPTQITININNDGKSIEKKKDKDEDILTHEGRNSDQEVLPEMLINLLKRVVFNVFTDESKGIVVLKIEEDGTFPFQKFKKLPNSILKMKNTAVVNACTQTRTNLRSFSTQTYMESQNCATQTSLELRSQTTQTRPSTSDGSSQTRHNMVQSSTQTIKKLKNYGTQTLQDQLLDNHERSTDMSEIKKSSIRKFDCCSQTELTQKSIGIQYTSMTSNVEVQVSIASDNVETQTDCNMVSKETEVERTMLELMTNEIETQTEKLGKSVSLQCSVLGFDTGVQVVPKLSCEATQTDPRMESIGIQIEAVSEIGCQVVPRQACVTTQTDSHMKSIGIQIEAVSENVQGTSITKNVAVQTLQSDNQSFGSKGQMFLDITDTKNAQICNMESDKMVDIPRNTDRKTSGMEIRANSSQTGNEVPDIQDENKKDLTLLINKNIHDLKNNETMLNKLGINTDQKCPEDQTNMGTQTGHFLPTNLQTEAEKIRQCLATQCTILNSDIGIQAVPELTEVSTQFHSPNNSVSIQTAKDLLCVTDGIQTCPNIKSAATKIPQNIDQSTEAKIPIKLNAINKQDIGDIYGIITEEESDLNILEKKSIYTDEKSESSSACTVPKKLDFCATSSDNSKNEDKNTFSSFETDYTQSKSISNSYDHSSINSASSFDQINLKSVCSSGEEIDMEVHTNKPEIVMHYGQKEYPTNITEELSEEVIGDKENSYEKESEPVTQYININNRKSTKNELLPCPDLKDTLEHAEIINERENGSITTIKQNEVATEDIIRKDLTGNVTFVHEGEPNTHNQVYVPTLTENISDQENKLKEIFDSKYQFAKERLFDKYLVDCVRRSEIVNTLYDNLSNANLPSRNNVLRLYRDRSFEEIKHYQNSEKNAIKFGDNFAIEMITTEVQHMIEVKRKKELRARTRLEQEIRENVDPGIETEEQQDIIDQIIDIEEEQQHQNSDIIELPINNVDNANCDNFVSESLKKHEEIRDELLENIQNAAHIFSNCCKESEIIQSENDFKSLVSFESLEGKDLMSNTDLSEMSDWLPEPKCYYMPLSDFDAESPYRHGKHISWEEEVKVSVISPRPAFFNQFHPEPSYFPDSEEDSFENENETFQATKTDKYSLTNNEQENCSSVDKFTDNKDIGSTRLYTVNTEEDKDVAVISNNYKAETISDAMNIHTQEKSVPLCLELKVDCRVLDNTEGKRNSNSLKNYSTFIDSKDNEPDICDKTFSTGKSTSNLPPDLILKSSVDFLKVSTPLGDTHKQIQTNIETHSKSDNCMVGMIDSDRSKSEVGTIDKHMKFESKVGIKDSVTEEQETILPAVRRLSQSKLFTNEQDKDVSQVQNTQCGRPRRLEPIIGIVEGTKKSGKKKKKVNKKSQLPQTDSNCLSFGPNRLAPLNHLPSSLPPLYDVPLALKPLNMHATIGDKSLKK